MGVTGQVLEYHVGVRVIETFYAQPDILTGPAVTRRLRLTTSLHPSQTVRIVSGASWCSNNNIMTLYMTLSRHHVVNRDVF